MARIGPHSVALSAHHVYAVDITILYDEIRVPVAVTYTILLV